MPSIGERFLWFLVLIILDFLVQAVSRDDRDSDYSNTCFTAFSGVLSLGKSLTLKTILRTFIVVCFVMRLLFPTVLFFRFPLFSGAWIDYFIVIVLNRSQGVISTHRLQVIWICIFKSLYLDSTWSNLSIFREQRIVFLAAFQILVPNYSTAL